jgi:hypothetical protein
MNYLEQVIIFKRSSYLRYISKIYLRVFKKMYKIFTQKNQNQYQRCDHICEHVKFH